MKNTTKFCQIYLFFSKKLTIFFDKFSDISKIYLLLLKNGRKDESNNEFVISTLKTQQNFVKFTFFSPKKITIFFDKFSDIFPKSISFGLKMVEKMKVTLNLSFPHEKHNFFFIKFTFFSQKK